MYRGMEKRKGLRERAMGEGGTRRWGGVAEK
jgi:hypothetical protein